jgi:hypothetical protein
MFMMRCWDVIHTVGRGEVLVDELGDDMALEVSEREGWVGWRR